MRHFRAVALPGRRPIKLITQQKQRKVSVSYISADDSSSFRYALCPRSMHCVLMWLPFPSILVVELVTTATWVVSLIMFRVCILVFISKDSWYLPQAHVRLLSDVWENLRVFFASCFVSRYGARSNRLGKKERNGEIKRKRKRKLVLGCIIILLDMISSRLVIVLHLFCQKQHFDLVVQQVIAWIRTV